MSQHRLERVVAGFYGTLWAIQPEKMQQLAVALEYRLSHGPVAHDDRRKRTDRNAAVKAPITRAGKNSGSGKAVAIIPIFGTISQRASIFSSYSGGTSVNQLTAQIRGALADDSVSTIVFQIDSPGGSVSGIQELAQEILAARGQKKMIAVSDTLMASAAYWLGCCADEVVVSPSSLTGSIGVLAVHTDCSALNEQMGMKVTYITAGKFKAEGNEDTPLTDEARAAEQSLVDSYYGQFTAGVAKARKTTATAVQNGFGQGRVLTASDAVKAGLADRIASFDDVLAKLGTSDPRKAYNATAGSRSLSAAAKKADPADPGDDDALPDDEDCDCICDECQAGNCEACSNAGCEDDGCDDCPNQDDEDDDNGDATAAAQRAHTAREREMALLSV